MFYAGIGGHLEKNESLTECAQREANEEIGVGVTLFSSPKTYYLPNKDNMKEIKVKNFPRPLALYEMIYPRGIQNEGASYYIIIYRAELKEEPKYFKKDEVNNLIGLTEKQLIKSISRKTSIGRLIEEGALIIGNIDKNKMNKVVYPIGTAKAIAEILYKKKYNI